jgi:transcriptional regulator with XRE-family HTH domain
MTEPQSSAFGETLKAWRARRHLSQLDLALDANVSARHISFMETGRSKPSREMVLQLAETMSLPLRARNDLLEQAGYVRAFAETGLDAETLGPVRMALDHMLASHMPYPALICDRHWTLVDANPAARALLAPLHIDGDVQNMVRMVVTNPIAKTLILNWTEVVRDFAGRLRLEVSRSGGDPVLRELLDLVRIDGEAPEQDRTSARPFIPVLLRHGESTLSLMSMLAEFGTARDITIGDLRIELFFPGDGATETFLRTAAEGFFK